MKLSLLGLNSCASCIAVRNCIPFFRVCLLPSTSAVGYSRNYPSTGPTILFGRTIVKRLFGLVVLLFVGNLAAAQTAVVTHNVNLRPDASTNGTPLTKLDIGTQVELLEADQTNGYFHIKAADGTEGWQMRGTWAPRTCIRTRA